MQQLIHRSDGISLSLQCQIRRNKFIQCLLGFRIQRIAEQGFVQAFHFSTLLVGHPACIL